MLKQRGFNVAVKLMARHFRPEYNIWASICDLGIYWMCAKLFYRYAWTTSLWGQMPQLCHVVQEMSFKIFLIWSCAGPPVQWSEPLMQFWKRTSWETFMWRYIKFGPVVQEEMSFKDISYLELWWPFCSVEWNHLCNFGRWYGSGGDIF